MLRSTLASSLRSVRRHRPAVSTTVVQLPSTIAHNQHQHQHPHPPHQQHSQQQMSFHFASSDYAASFQGVPVPDIPKIRQSAVEYLDQFDPQSWYDDPIVSLLNGKELRGGATVDTVDALGRVNGRQDYATKEQIEALKQHIQTYQPPQQDYREAMRQVEQRLLSPEFSGLLIGNQCLDFSKQDGVTEIEESIMANHVERNLNDLLLRDEAAGILKVQRKPIYVSCVSNFTNFLDLFRKTLRSMEVGIPCVVLGRSNTVQHTFRWTKLLMDLSMEHGVDPGMITYLSCSLEDIVDITQSLQAHTGNLYATCSRDLAATIKSGYPNTVASTGGPNTLIALDWTPPIQEAIRMSATIESSGQCTALRHAVVPPFVKDEEVQDMLARTQSIDSAANAMKARGFDGVFSNHAGTPPGPSGNGYQRHPTADASYRILTEQFPPNHIEEHWRKVVVDISKMDTKKHLDDLADWLNTNQPISMAVTGKTREESLEVGLALWAQTGLVVNTIGTPESPALTCQARPQEAEVFGEFPPRRELSKYTKYPVVVPSSTPGYDSAYTDSFLKQQAAKSQSSSLGNSIGAFLNDISDDLVKGYCVTLLEYLKDATQENPKRSFGSVRTAMWGLQRPPLKTKTYLQCGKSTKWDELAPALLLFFATNAKDQVVVSVPKSNNEDIAALCQKHGIPTVKTTVTEELLRPGDNLYPITTGTAAAGPMNTANFPMVGQFLTLLLPVDRKSVV